MNRNKYFIVGCLVFVIGWMILENRNLQVVEKSLIANEKFIPDDVQYFQRAYPYERIDYQTIKENNSFRLQAQVATRNDNDWNFAGPVNIDGRVTDIELRPNVSDDIYVGTASGGLFQYLKSSNTWKALFDNEVNLAIGDFAFSETDNNIIYLGTGEANAGGGSLAYDGNGMYKSVDAGETWIHIGLEDIGGVGKVIVNPVNDNECYVAAMGRLFLNDNNRGIYKTTNGGESWEQVLFVNDSTGGVDLVIDPSSPATVYAATWERIRRPGSRKYGGSGSGIFKSTDSGQTWSKLSSGLPSSSGRIGLTISASEPNVLYASLVNAEDQHLEGIYKSTDGGINWQAKNIDDITSVPFMYWFGKIEVDPSNSNIVYFTGLSMWKSTNGGDSWSQIFFSSHVDHHAIVIDRNNTERVVNGNDGGVNESLEGGYNDTDFTGLPNTQFYTCEIDYSNPEILYGGSQDNGTNRTIQGGSQNWEFLYGGDGLVVKVDPENNQYIYAEYQYGNLAKSIDGGLSFNQSVDGIGFSDRRNWKSPIELDPSNPSTLYFGTNRLYKSTNRADNWSPVSGDLTSNPVQQGLTFGTLTSISVSSLDQNSIVVGTDDGNVQVTNDGGNSWMLVSDLLPNRWVTAVEMDPNERNGIYVTYSGYRFGEAIGHVYYSDDFGANWNDISGNLPDVPVNDIVVVPGNSNLYIATDIGTFMSESNGESWVLLNSGLPNVVVTDLAYHPPTGKLVAATYGRGMYTLDAEEPVSNTSNFDAFSFGVQVFPNPFSEYINVEFQAENLKNINLQLFTASGNLLLNETLKVSKPDTDVILTKDILAGVYFLQVTEVTSGIKQTIKLVKL